MSTFDGKVKEFPDIRIDHFRLSGQASSPPLAYFLSHVHSDHLEGLESCKSPFIYCSPATKEILLRLEKYPHRMNFAKGILEARKQTYRHLRKLLKTIPLETPTVLDLAPGKSIRVTLFDANHCVGAVMFLIEGDGRAVLYSGDIRSELWWVNNLVRHPLLLSYALNGRKTSLKQLDCIYLDTTFANKENPYKHFPSKADGILELLQKVSKYPKDTIFYFDTWTFGYEDVWLALCGFLNCQVHVDDYRYKLYRALAAGEGIKAEEAARLFGYKCGNHMQKGCLTERQTRLHSCEQGTGCEVFRKPFVRVTPIISRHEGVEMAELGAGGGKGDLDQQHELEVGDASALGMLMSLCATKLQGQPKLLSSVIEMLTLIMQDPVRAIALDAAILHSERPDGDQNEDMTGLGQMPLDSLIPALASLAAQAKGQNEGDAMVAAAVQEAPQQDRSTNLPSRITFPYSRHSSYTELCHLIEAFKPKDIWPCTVDKANWSAAKSMSFLFGHLYDAPCKFSHDQMMFSRHTGTAKGPSQSNSETSDEYRSAVSDRVKSNPDTAHASAVSESVLPFDSNLPDTAALDAQSRRPAQLPLANDKSDTISMTASKVTRKRRRSDDADVVVDELPSTAHARSIIDNAYVPLSPNDYSEAWKQQAFEAALGTSSTSWNDITLVSVSGHEKEEEL